MCSSKSSFVSKKVIRCMIWDIFLDFECNNLRVGKNESYKNEYWVIDAQILEYKAEQLFESNIIINHPLWKSPIPLKKMSEPTPGTEQLNLKVKSQDGEEVFFKIKASTQLKKLMDAYCQRQSVIYFLNLVVNQQRAIPVWWWETPRDTDPQGTQHGEWWRDRCRRRTGRRITMTQRQNNWTVNS